MASRRSHRWRGKWHPEGCDGHPVFGAGIDGPHWHVTCRDKGCEGQWIQPVLFDPRPFELIVA
jgi:hypothetical protein